MGLNPDAVGHRTEPVEHAYRWQDVALYALGIGASEAQLDYLYEKRGPLVYPTYAVVPAYEPNRKLFEIVGGDLSGVVHGSQKITMHAPIPPSGTLRTVGEVIGIYDLRRMAQSVTKTTTTDADGTLLFETEWTIMYLKDGGFGGDPPPRSPKIRPPERAPDFRVEASTTPEQAMLYRLGGHDYNPLHIDPEAAMKAEKVTQGRPILHGLCTYGFIARAIIERWCEGDATRLKTFYGRFSKPIWPGETIVTEGWKHEGRHIVRAVAGERPDEPIFNHSYAELSD